MVLDDQQSIPRVAQTLARFLYVESCSQCTACKTGLEGCSKSLDELLDHGNEVDTGADDSIDRAVMSALHAPQGNRCYLPVQGSILVTSLVSAFHEDFLAFDAGGSAGKWPCPKLADFDERSRVFVLDEQQNRKTPEWTYDDVDGEGSKRT